MLIITAFFHVGLNEIDREIDTLLILKQIVEQLKENVIGLHQQIFISENKHRNCRKEH